MDLRHNPYLRLRSSKSPSVRASGDCTDENLLSPVSAALIPVLTHLDGDNGQIPLATKPARCEQTPSKEGELPKQVESLRSR